MLPAPDDKDSGLAHRCVSLCHTPSTVSPSSSSNRAAGRSVTLLIDNSAGAQRTFSFNSSWKFIGEKPAAIAANKIGILSLTAFGTAETDVVCSYGVQD